ncbi:MATE family efflux transporter DinF [Candidatus Profftia tarda]|uniref:DNA-damage-inducible protein F n=1 Tax=Candidatus Profftia tarda TaxID=1177216 RepID=A0A8E4GHM9_9ENTR|nr:MATE family efflux transporter DinF [Candidatus Profftia tarda]CAD6507154.1 DNA-damage-inducible protein F [Candidatus Profftia tarda]
MKLFRCTDKELWILAFPMILSNISVALLGLVDTMVIGHLGNPVYLGGVSLGTMATSFLFMLLLFLRMSTTGLTAQAFAILDKDSLASVFMQPMILAMSTGIVITIMRDLFIHSVLLIFGQNYEVLEQAQVFMHIRLLSAPATLSNLVILGWLLGVQCVRAPVIILVICNFINIILNLYFVRLLHWNVFGTATATVIADYIALFLYMVLACHVMKLHGLRLLHFRNKLQSKLRCFLVFNRDIMLRSFLLQLCPVSLTVLSARMGCEVLSVNAVLINFMNFTSYVLDGFAHAVEAYSGQSYGARDEHRLQSIWYAACRQAGFVAIFFSLFYALFGHQIILILTGLPNLQSLANYYLPWQIILPLLGVWCYLLDGMFIGATRGADMRNSMVIALSGYILTLLTLPWLGNHGLWLGMAVFLTLRGLCLWIIWQRNWRNKTWFEDKDINLNN